jgi:hypothetical protein
LALESKWPVDILAAQNPNQMNPQTAKLRFKFRTFNNWLIVVGIFVFVAAVFDTLIADAIAIAVLFYLYFFILDKRTIGMDCNHCGKHIASNTPWVCDFCKEPNKNANEHPFVDKCTHCGNEPKTYKCHHDGCRKLIFLTDDKLETNYAYCINAPSEIPEPPKPDERTVKVKTYQENKQDKEHELDVAKLDEQLKQIKERIDGPKIKTPFEQKKESFDKYYDGVMGMREYARKKRAEAAETYRDDPESLKDANEAIDEFLKRSA